MTRWQPIDTAPKDGTRLLLWDSRLDIAISGIWHTEDEVNNSSAHESGWSWWCADDDLVMWDDGYGPTHWQPLPEPPNVT